jgi:surface-anchored protein
LGVAAGEPIYFWPQTLIAGRIFAGFEAESVPAGTFAAVSTGDTRAPSVEPWLKVELVDVRFFDLEGNAGDADFSLWQVPGQGAPPKVWMSTADGGITASDVFYVTEGGHAHANWGFGQAGYYQIDFRLSGVLAGSLETVATPVTTWHFGVEHQPMAIPEVSTIALLALALGVGWVARRKFHSSEQTKTNQN